MYSYSYDQKNNINDANDNALGLILRYKTDPFDGIGFGVSGSASFNMFSNTNEDSYGLLNDEGDKRHQGYYKWNEYYVSYEHDSTAIKYGAQILDEPFLSQDSTMMFPKTYKAAILHDNTFKNLDLGLYYITDYSNYTDNHFENIINRIDQISRSSPLVGASVRYDHSLAYGNLTLTNWSYKMDNVFRADVLRNEYALEADEKVFYVTPVYIRQDSDGDAIGGEFSTYQYGAEIGADTDNNHYKLFFANTGKSDLFSPWSFGEIIVQQYLFSGRTDEKAYAAEYSYDFNGNMLEGLSVDMSAGLYNVPHADELTRRNAREIDISLRYAADINVIPCGAVINAGYASVDYDMSAYLREYYIKQTYNFKGRFAGFSTVLKDTFYDYKDSDNLNDLQIRLIYSFAVGGI